MPAHSLVYVIDDDDAVRDSLCVLLECTGFAVRPYASAAAFRRDLPPERNSCLLIDADMPGTSGVELFRRLRREGITTPTIIMTGALSPIRSPEAERAGAAYLQKPFRAGELLARIEEALRRYRP